MNRIPRKRSQRNLRPSRIVNISDLRELAQRRLPRSVFDYLDGGAEGESTLRANTEAFQIPTFRPRCAVAVKDCSLAVSVLGQTFSLPFILAPIGYSRLLHPSGEVGAARAAGEFGTGYTLSTISGYRLEDVKAASQEPVWFQLYLLGGREAGEPAIRRARDAGFSALVVTVDTPVAGLRERDTRNGIAELMGKSPLAKLPYLPNVLAHPGWLAGFLRDGGVPKLENVVLPGKGPMELIDVGAALARSAVTWADLSWIRKIWTGPLVIKGILTGEDAQRAIEEGASAVVVSNHGGRQLDGVSSTLRALPEVVKAVHGRIEVLMDGGVRSGSDIVKGLCLGARAVLIGRAYAYGLGAAGYPGVLRALEILRTDLERTLRLLGCSAVSELDASYVQLPNSW